MIKGILILISVLFFCLFYRERKENEKILNTIDNMLDLSTEGNYKDIPIDESLLSKIEIKFVDYLNQSQITKAKLQREKDIINGLISDISHQTKTPLSNIILYSDILLQKEGISQDFKENLEVISNQSEKLKFLIESLVNLSRLETGILILKPVENEINTSIEKVISQLKSRALEKNIKINYEGTKEKAIFDSKWTEEAIYNVLENGIKYSKENSNINIDVTSYELFSRIDIKDEGIGISEEDFPKVFQRFYRSPKVSKTEGVGIGLHLTRKILASQGGYIKVFSKENKGSTFSIFLPRE